METAVASTELSLLGWSVILLLLQVVAQATAASDLGPTYLFSPRDEQRESQERDCRASGARTATICSRPTRPSLHWRWD